MWATLVTASLTRVPETRASLGATTAPRKRPGSDATPQPGNAKPVRVTRRRRSQVAAIPLCPPPTHVRLMTAGGRALLAAWLVAMSAGACAQASPSARGTLIAAVALEEGGNEVVRVDLERGAAETLWTTDAGQAATEFDVSAQDGVARYRLSHPLRDRRESIVIRALTPDALPTPVVLTHAGEPRIAGTAWAFGGIAYGLQSGIGTEDGVEPSFELHTWIDGVARRRLVLDPRPASPYLLVSWAEVGALSVAALLRLPAQGGPADQLVLVREDGGPRRELAINAGSGGWAASPSASWLATIDADSGAVAVFDLEHAERAELTPVAAGDARTFGLVWSADSRVLAWTEAAAGQSGRLRWLPTLVLDREGGVLRSFPDQGHAKEWNLPTGSRVLDLSPSGDAVLIEEADAGLATYELPGGERRTVPWRPSAPLWQVEWIP